MRLAPEAVQSEATPRYGVIHGQTNEQLIDLLWSQNLARAYAHSVNPSLQMRQDIVQPFASTNTATFDELQARQVTVNPLSSVFTRGGFSGSGLSGCAFFTSASLTLEFFVDLSSTEIDDSLSVVE
jgi:hypothetical protein